MCSNILPGIGKREIGRRSETFLEFRTLGKGMTIASFHSDGTLHVRKVNSVNMTMRTSLTKSSDTTGFAYMYVYGYDFLKDSAFS